MTEGQAFKYLLNKVRDENLQVSSWSLSKSGKTLKAYNLEGDLIVIASHDEVLRNQA